MNDKPITALFSDAMVGKIPTVERASWEPLLTDSLVNKASERVEGMRTMSRKQLRTLIALMELRYYTLMTQLSTCDNGVEMARISGRLQEATGLLAFYRQMLGFKEGEQND